MSILFNMNYVIGLDIGGTKITGIVFDGEKIVEELTIVTPKTLLEFERNLLKLADFLTAKYKISAIGIGMAGIINPEKKVAVFSPNIKYINNFDFKKLFGKKLKLEVNNDAECFAYAEAKMGLGKDKALVAGVTLGTGVGGGFVINGKIYSGANHGAFEVGHMLYNSSTTLEKVFQKARDKGNNKVLSEVVGIILCNICRITDPDIIVLGGGVALDKKRNFINRAKAICEKALSSYKIKPQIVVSKLKHAGALGAALLVK